MIVRHLTITFTALLSGALGVAAFTEIGGDLPARVTAARSPYLVVSDIYVPVGKTTIVEAGAVFLFRNFTGLKIQGVMNAQGSVAKPVVFTSEFDSVYNHGQTTRANPYDWNGIYVDKDAMGTDLQDIQLLYSVYGITAMTKFIRIKEGVFRYNGRGNVTIEGKAQEVTDVPYSYSISVKDAMVDGVSVKILQDPLARKRNIIRYSGIGLAAAGLVVGIVYTLQSSDAQAKLNQLSGTDFNNLYNNTSSDWNGARNAKYGSLSVMAAGYGLFLIGAVGVGWSFTF